jgi:hypothetical protein
LIVTGNAQWLAHRFAVIAALLMLVIAPATEEVFFNVLHIQFHLALCVALILALDVPRRAMTSVGYGLLLFLGPLCGPASIAIMPLFALRGVIDRDRRRLIQFAALSSGAAVQLLLFYGSSPARGHVADPGVIAAAMFVRLFVAPVFGIDIANRVAWRIHASQVAETTQWWWFAAATALSYGALIAVAWRRRDAAVWFALSSLMIAVVSFGFGIIIVDPADLLNVVLGERYNFLPVVLLGMTFVVLAMRPETEGRTLFALLCILILVSGAYYYAKPLAQFSDGPSWRTQVQIWRGDHRHALAVWPSPWSADLSDETRACSPPGPNLARSPDPGYCESGWIAGHLSPRLSSAVDDGFVR